MDKINPEMLILARESRGMSQVGLARAMGITQGKVSKYENGLLPITPCDLKQVSVVLEYTEEFFFQPDAVCGLGSSFIFHRKRKNIPINLQRKIQAQVNILCMRVSRLLRSVEIEHENRFQTLDVDEYGGHVERVAATARAFWKVPHGPVLNVTALIESAGGIVVKAPFETRLIDAVHLWPPGLPPLFFVNNDLPGDRLRWTLAHEIGHAIMHRLPSNDVEEQANKFTGEFLMPRAEIKAHLFDLTLERAAVLKPYWKVSMAAIIRRAKDLGCITDRKYRSLCMSLNAQGYRLVEPFPVQVEEPALLDKIYGAHLTDLGYSQTDLELRMFLPQPDNAILPFSKGPKPPFYRSVRIAR
jgi:Zn-dependent peptidase ImmA (M78 family)/transcriptional regulator with XRE-family HTH domain